MTTPRKDVALPIEAPLTDRLEHLAKAAERGGDQFDHAVAATMREAAMALSRPAPPPVPTMGAILSAILTAKLPEGYQWGADAMENFRFGLDRAAGAVRNMWAVPPAAPQKGGLGEPKMRLEDTASLTDTVRRDLLSSPPVAEEQHAEILDIINSRVGNEIIADRLADDLMDAGYRKASPHG